MTDQWTLPADLNRLEIDADGGYEKQQDYGAVSADGSAEVVFKNLPHRLCRLIRQYPAVVGCVAWLTHFDILDMLATRESVSLVVQKEDFLRPDIGADYSGWKALLRRKYNALPGDERYTHVGCVVSGLSYCGDPTLEAIRCVGNHNADKNPAFPRAHHKFLVFGRIVTEKGETFTTLEGKIMTHERTVFKPAVVWTGSFNLTQNAARSFENAVILRDPKLVDAFYQEWGQLVALSEPLDWENDWVCPEWRIGT